jgi:hypothetical protein
MKITVVTLLIIISAKLAHAQNIDELEMQLNSLTSPQKKQKILEKHLPIFAENGVAKAKSFSFIIWHSTTRKPSNQ